MACLFVASLNASYADQQLNQALWRHFQRYGQLLSIKVLRDGNRRPYAFVQFKQVTAANRARQDSQRAQVCGRAVRIEAAHVNCTLFVARIGRELAKQDLTRIMSEFGEMTEEFNLLMNYYTGQSKGCGFAHYKYREDALLAYSCIRSCLPWAVEWASHADKLRHDSGDRRSIYVTQLSDAVTEDELRQKFAAFGNISSLNFHPRRELDDGEFQPPYCIVKFERAEDAQLAIDTED